MTSLSPQPLRLTSPAKLNLFLHITGRRPDGYHNLQTLFQLLDRGDELDITATTTTDIVLTPDIPGVATNDNLIVRAAQLLQQETGCTLGANVHLTKVLPMGGGLGGGSSNAATTLLGLNHLWQLHLSKQQLMSLGEQLGADVPVFIYGHSAWAEGIGEQLTPVSTEQWWYLVIIPPVQVSTATIFNHEGLTRNTHPIKIRAFLDQGLGQSGRNDCQDVVETLHPEVKQARVLLDSMGTEALTTARLTGTGACLFAPFKDHSAAMLTLSKMENAGLGVTGFVAKGVNQSPLEHQLPPIN